MVLLGTIGSAGVFSSAASNATMVASTPEQIRAACYPGSPMLNSDLCWGQVAPEYRGIVDTGERIFMQPQPNFQNQYIQYQFIQNQRNPGYPGQWPYVGYPYPTRYPNLPQVYPVNAPVWSSTDYYPANFFPETRSYGNDGLVAPGNSNPVFRAY